MTTGAVPDDVLAVAAVHLDGLPDHEVEMFGARLVRWWEDLRDGLAAAYEPAVADELAVRLVGLAAAAFAARPAELQHLDLSRMLEPDWYQRPRMLGYAAYADRFAGDLRGVAAHVDYLAELGVTYLHLMPLLQPRPDRTTGDMPSPTTAPCAPTWGRSTISARLPLSCAAAGSACASTSSSTTSPASTRGPWPPADGDERYRRYFHIFPDRSTPDAYERTLPEVFPDLAPGNFTWDDDVAGWVWTTFNEWQWDVDWSNPDVVCEYADVILFFANLGVEVLRLDAIAFIWKRLGTTSQNEPEVHAITQTLRAARPPGLPGGRVQGRGDRVAERCRPLPRPGPRRGRSATSPTTTA